MTKMQFEKLVDFKISKEMHERMRKYIPYVNFSKLLRDKLQEALDELEGIEREVKQ